MITNKQQNKKTHVCNWKTEINIFCDVSFDIDLKNIKYFIIDFHSENHSWKFGKFREIFLIYIHFLLKNSQIRQ